METIRDQHCVVESHLSECSKSTIKLTYCAPEMVVMRLTAVVVGASGNDDDMEGRSEP